MILRIGTLNCQNNEENRLNKNNCASKLASEIINQNYDILGTQEITINFHKNIMKYLIGYNSYGNYQYNELLSKNIPLLKDYNQSNKIFIRYKVNRCSTFSLPWVPLKYNDVKRGLKKKSITKRIVTVVNINIENNNIYVLNVHLDYYIQNVQEKQLDYLIRRIDKYKELGYIILLGDFNLTTDDEIFKSFITKLDEMNIIRVGVNDKTNASKYRAKSAIDHIFVSRKFKIINSGTFDIENNITDHKAVFADIEI